MYSLKEQVNQLAEYMYKQVQENLYSLTPFRVSETRVPWKFEQLYDSKRLK